MKLIESKRKAAGWVLVAVLINFSAIGFGLAIYEARMDCWLAASTSVIVAVTLAWRLA